MCDDFGGLRNKEPHQSQGSNSTAGASVCVCLEQNESKDGDSRPNHNTELKNRGSLLLSPVLTHFLPSFLSSFSTRSLSSLQLFCSFFKNNLDLLD